MSNFYSKIWSLLKISNEALLANQLLSSTQLAQRSASLVVPSTSMVIREWHGIAGCVSNMSPGMLLAVLPILLLLPIHISGQFGTCE